MRFRSNLPLVLAGLMAASIAGGAEHMVSQTGKTFSAKSLTVKVGDTVSFRNDDPFVHNIFSLSDVQSFDLGTFAKGEVRKVKIEKAGVIEIECAVHPEMKLTVTASR
jgi:plastocyanin